MIPGWESTMESHFNPHLPCGRWPRKDRETRDKFLFQSTPSLRKVTIKISSTIWEYGISIHTFLAEGDNFNVFSSSNDSYFNPHLPCGRWHASGTIGITLPDFNPHLPCGRWLLLSAMAISASDFNPHLPCGRWPHRLRISAIVGGFQSTPSLRKVTKTNTEYANDLEFQSTPSLRKVTLCPDFHR